jgi:hypothetical protein
MKRWLETLLGLALVAAWAAVASTASEATVREDTGGADAPISTQAPQPLAAGTLLPRL